MYRVFLKSAKKLAFGDLFRRDCIVCLLTPSGFDGRQTM